MDILKLLLQQDAEILIPCVIGGLVMLNWAFKLLMMVVKIGVAVSIVAALSIYLPHVY